MDRVTGMKSKTLIIVESSENGLVVLGTKINRLGVAVYDRLYAEVLQRPSVARVVVHATQGPRRGLNPRWTSWSKTHFPVLSCREFLSTIS